jgi:Protein of unknown function (DUF2877)
MTARIISIGRRALDALQAAEDWRVEAVFERSCYLRSGDMFVCLGDASIGDGPLNVITSTESKDEAQPRAVQVSGPVRSSGGQLRFAGGSELDFAAAPIWTMPPWPSRAERRTLGADRIAAIIARAPSGGLFRLAINPQDQPQRPDTTRAANGIRSLYNGLQPGAAAGLLKSGVAALLGLGPGLTPSGDDLLAGVMLALHAAHPEAAASLGAVIKADAARLTSPLSAALLQAAVAGECSAALQRALSACLTGRNLPAALATLDGIGHTSGWDHLAGFLLTIPVSRPMT